MTQKKHLEICPLFRNFPKPWEFTGVERDILLNKTMEPSNESLRRVTISSEYRSLKSTKARVHHLHEVGRARQSEIVEMLGVPKSTVSRWINHPDTLEGQGSHGYLHPDDYKALFEEIVPSRSADHKPMTTEEIFKEVCQFHSKKGLELNNSTGNEIEEGENSKSLARASWP